MSAILTLLRKSDLGPEMNLDFAAHQAIPDLQRLVSWVESAEHKHIADCNIIYGGECDCGLTEILKLIRS